MDIGFDLYKVFYYVCEFKSVTKAANYLCVSQPAVTKHIKNLESIVGYNLITKVPKGIELTEYGQKLFEEIKSPVSKLLSLEVNSFKNMIIKVSAGHYITDRFLAKSMMKMNEKYEDLRFSLGNYYYKESIQRLRDGKLDIAFLNLRPNYYFSIDLVSKDFCELHDIFVISSKVKDLYPSKIKLSELNDYPIISKYGISSSRMFLENFFGKNGDEFKCRYNLSNHYLIEKYVKEGLGIGLVTKEFVQDKLDSSEYIMIETDIELPARKIVYVTRKNSRYNEILYEFVSFIKSYNCL